MPQTLLQAKRRTVFPRYSSTLRAVSQRSLQDISLECAAAGQLSVTETGTGRVISALRRVHACVVKAAFAPFSLVFHKWKQLQHPFARCVNATTER